MTNSLWTLDEIIAATGATVSEKAGAWEGVPPDGLKGSSPSRTAPVTGISIDTRSITPGDLFVALRDVRDGHEFVTTAFSNGATAALVSRQYQRQPGDGMLLHVDDPLRALEELGVAARARLTPDARVIAVTGSVGKTTTKEMLRACLTPLGKTHAADKSFNNHWGVPLTLARMPANTQYGVCEIGMNHAGEITPLTKMVRPHVAIVTTVEAVHLEHFRSVEEIAEAKAEIFTGLEPGGTAILPGNNAHYPLLAAAANTAGANVVSFGLPLDLAGKTQHKNSLDMTSCEFEEDQSSPQTVWVNSRPGHLHDEQMLLRFSLGLRGSHMAKNATAVVLTLDRLGVPDLEAALIPLATMAPPPGRGSRTMLEIESRQAILIDESYNANPASMRAALAAATQIDQDAYPRRIAVLGDMLELGPDSASLHLGLADAIQDNAIDLVFACGPQMKHLYDALPANLRGLWAPTSGDLTNELLNTVRGGDVVMIKGSNGSRMAPLVDALKARHIAAR